MVAARRIAFALAAVLLSAVCTLLFFLPFPRETGAEQDVYLCSWENGETTIESYSAAYPALVGASQEGLLLEREGMHGTIPVGEEFIRAVETFEQAQLAELLEFRLGEISRLERAALWKTYGKRGYYAGGFFAWDGERIFRSERKTFEEVVLLSGDLPKGLLFDTGAKKLIIAGGAELTAKALTGSGIEEAAAFAPYIVLNGAVYLETVAGRTCVAALPSVEELVIDCDFIAQGALAPCIKLKRLTLPKEYDGTLKILFGETPVPEELICL